MERVTLIGMHTTSTLSATDHVSLILSQANPTFISPLYRLKSLGLSSDAVDTLYSALIVSKITYGLISFFGQLSVDDVKCIFKEISEAWSDNKTLYHL